MMTSASGLGELLNTALILALLAAAFIFPYRCRRLFQLQSNKGPTAVVAGLSGSLGFFIAWYLTQSHRITPWNMAGQRTFVITGGFNWTGLVGLIGMAWFVGIFLATVLYALAPRLERKL